MSVICTVPATPTQTTDSTAVPNAAAPNAAAPTPEAFLAVLDDDARDSLAAMELVLAQPSISSQLIDNLNASMHLRALLTDVFLIGEVLRTQYATAKSAKS